MKFLDELRAYLERPWRAGVIPAPPARRRNMLAALQELERQGAPTRRITQLHERISSNFDVYLIALVALITETLGDLSARRLSKLIDVAFRRMVGFKETTHSIALDLELDRLLRDLAQDPAGTMYEWLRHYEMPQYAREISAVRQRGASVELTQIGKIILDLPSRDALRWVLAVESVQSHGRGDIWRISTRSATLMVDAPQGVLFWNERNDGSWPLAWEALDRLSAMGLLAHDNAQSGIVNYEVLPEGRSLLQEIASGKDTPFILLARALLQDETAAILGQYPATASLVRQENAAAIAVRHARMVAHEVRNALVPVQVTLSELYEEIERSGQGDASARYRERLDAGIGRIFSFVRDVAQTADLATKPAELFQLVPAIETAAGVIGAEIGRAVGFLQEAELPLVLGHRERFEWALVNVLRNAAQAREDPPVEIRVTAGVNNGAEVFVRVDDDGPGVVPEDRTDVFSPGFSRRPGGSGEGLAFVREVVEAEMAGRVVYEESPMGGARFVVRLPVGTRRRT